MSCSYYTFKSSTFSGDYWCTKKDCEVSEDIYYKFCRDYNYGDCPIYKKSESSSGCFITTALCQILGKSDNDYVLNNLRKFRDNVLQKNSEYYDVLKEYDVIGPKLAEALLNDRDKEVMAKGIYENVILRINGLILQGEYKKAIENYYVMTLMLVNYYGLKNEYNKLKDEGYDYLDFDPKKAGHGRKRTIKFGVN